VTHPSDGLAGGAARRLCTRASCHQVDGGGDRLSTRPGTAAGPQRGREEHAQQSRATSSPITRRRRAAVAALCWRAKRAAVVSVHSAARTLRVGFAAMREPMPCRDHDRRSGAALRQAPPSDREIRLVAEACLSPVQDRHVRSLGPANPP